MRTETMKANLGGNNIQQQQPEQYHDYYNYSEESDRELAAVFDSSGNEKDVLGQLRAVGREGAFALQLHYMLRETKKENKEEIISWLPHGRAIMVHDKKRFETEILPLWFQQTKVESFQRQLNHYGFKRIGHGRDKNAYYHELFLRGKPELTHRMRRTKVKGTGRRKPTLPGCDPDFYAMPWMLEPEDYKTANAAPPATTGAATAPALQFQMKAAPHVQPANMAPPPHSAVAIGRKLQQQAQGFRSVSTPPESASVAQSQHTAAVPRPAVPTQRARSDSAIVPGLRSSYPGGLFHYPNEIAAETGLVGSEWMLRFPSLPFALPPLQHPLVQQQQQAGQVQACAGSTFWMSPVVATMPMTPLVPIVPYFAVPLATWSYYPTMNGGQQQHHQQPASEASSDPSSSKRSSLTFSSGSRSEEEN